MYESTKKGKKACCKVRLTQMLQAAEDQEERRRFLEAACNVMAGLAVGLRLGILPGDAVDYD